MATARFLAALIGTLLITECFSQGKYPCHDSNHGNVAAYGCTEVVLPNDLCTFCPLKDVHENGDFKDCRETYDTDASGCQAKLSEYVELNPCDWRRAQQFDQWINSEDQWNKSEAKVKLDYFIYSICEECCDCIPIGSVGLSFSEAQQDEDLLYHYSRGNCPAHAHYDICKVLPDIKGFKSPDEESASFEDKPNICGLLNQWFQNNQDWASKHDAVVSADIDSFLKNVNRKTQCSTEAIWSRCKEMEEKQGNIWMVEASDGIEQEEVNEDVDIEEENDEGRNEESNNEESTGEENVSNEINEPVSGSDGDDSSVTEETISTDNETSSGGQSRGFLGWLGSLFGRLF